MRLTTIIVFDDAGRLFHRLVGIDLQRHLAAAAQPLIGGDDDLRLAALDAPGQRIRREAAEHDGMHRSDPRARQHGVGGFRDHRQIDRDRVALLHAVLLQHVGETADLIVQLRDK